tara:strand:+ start:1927 stop:2757 length:831 start_codon:yes stop_codon:yes gene_type:complete
MATINIGNLAFTHKGDYASGTAYVKNDVVYYSTNGNAYIAKQATQGNVPTNGTYWNQFAQGSGGIWNAGLSLGSAGQVVKVNSGASALEFGTVSSDFVKLHSATASNVTSLSIDGYFSSDYKRYILMGRGIRNPSTSDFQWRVNTGGSTNTSSSYIQTNWYSYTDTTPSHSLAAGGMNEGSVDVDSPATRFEFNGDGMTDDEDTGCDLTIEIFDPQASNKWKNFAGSIWFVRNDKNTIQNWNQYAVFKSTTALTGITLQMRSGNLYGNFDLYGIKG